MLPMFCLTVLECIHLRLPFLVVPVVVVIVATTSPSATITSTSSNGNTSTSLSIGTQVLRYYGFKLLEC